MPDKCRGTTALEKQRKGKHVIKKLTPGRLRVSPTSPFLTKTTTDSIVYLKSTCKVAAAPAPKSLKSNQRIETRQRIT